MTNKIKEHTIKRITPNQHYAFLCPHCKDIFDIDEYINQVRQETLAEVEKMILTSIGIIISNYPTNLQEISRDNLIGMYNRIDELLLLYSDLKKESFDKVSKDLKLNKLLEELKQKLKELKQ